ncbi:unnamed protein product [Phyllotreta striolata]|uniref:Speckle targeted PIP5K1A-regulated poly(A) polymerase n=1 Tax=Phyllotreta striolata TaxID=444603 RepID=A0A9P0DNB2_PHYSR|nr:unnamed protein product [Phyllotreta striolata]
MEKKKPNENVKCEICNIEICSSTFQQHVEGQRHKRNADAAEHRRRAEEKCGIFVTGYPLTISQDELVTYFSKFGSIVWTYFAKNYSFIDFSDPAVVRCIMQTAHELHGKNLTIDYRKPKPINIKPDPNLEDTEATIESLKTAESFQQQLRILTWYLQGRTNGSKCNIICRDFRKILKASFPRCTIFPFGSSYTGLNICNSDIDIYISELRKDGEDDLQYLQKLKSLLNKSNCFSNVIVIGQAKIPILKCIHTPTNTSCDVNVRNLLGVCNSRLISYYISINPKIKEIMLIIKYWAKVHKITGRNCYFTNYSICLMIIFFLQSTSYKLPSVKLLQSDSIFDIIQEGWNGGFKPLPVDAPDLIAASSITLLRDFFSFYASFDYNTYIICPYLGEPIKKDLFEDPNNPLEDFNAYKEIISANKSKPLKTNATICVQDPFEHSRNTTPIVTKITLNNFMLYSCHARKLCEDGEQALLYKLFTESPRNVQVEKVMMKQFTQFGVNMSLNTTYLRRKLHEADSSVTKALKDLWFESVRDFALITLRDFLKFSVEENGGPSESKLTKTDDQTDIHCGEQFHIASFKCSAKLNLWGSRKAALKAFDKTHNNLIDKETEITKQLQEMYKHIDSQVNVIEFEVILKKNYEPAQVTFMLKRVYSYKKTFNDFCSFFAHKFGIWLEEYENDLNNDTG